MAGEQLVSAAGEQGLETVIIRPAAVYGPGGVNGMIPNLCRLINRGKFFCIGSGRNILPLVYLDDLINVLIKVAYTGSRGATYEITGPEAPTLREIVDGIAGNLGVQASRCRVPKPAARMAAWLSEIGFGMLQREPLLTRQRVDALTSHRRR